MIKNEIDRRLFERIESDYSGIFTTEDEITAKELSCLNISGGGIKVSTSSRIPEDKLVRIDLNYDREKNPLTLKTRLIWQREIDAGKWLAGLSIEPSSLVSMWPLVEKGREGDEM